MMSSFYVGLYVGIYAGGFCSEFSARMGGGATAKGAAVAAAQWPLSILRLVRSFFK